jgi:hypothetical protein
MFLFGRSTQSHAVSGFIRQLVDLTSPNRPPLDGDSRADTRSNRSLPALLAPWERGNPVVEEVAYALTKDFSDRGLALVLPQPFRAVDVVVGLWLGSPRFVLAEVRQNAALGGGFWQLGIEITELVDSGSPAIRPLAPLATRLIPMPSAARSARAT